MAWIQKRYNRKVKGGPVGKWSQERNFNIFRVYMFRTMDDHFGSQTAVVGSQHLQTISRTGERLGTVSHAQPHRCVLHIKSFIWSLSHPKTLYTM
jgi:hypothetical protein